MQVRQMLAAQVVLVSVLQLQAQPSVGLVVVVVAQVRLEQQVMVEDLTQLVRRTPEAEVGLILLEALAEQVALV
jgi:hypothetical protein